MAKFKRSDIMAAHCVLEWHWNVGGIVYERPTNRRRNRSTGFQLSGMGFKPHRDLEYRTLSKNGKAIYKVLCQRYGFVA